MRKPYLAPITLVFLFMQVAHAQDTNLLKLEQDFRGLSSSLEQKKPTDFQEYVRQDPLKTRARINEWGMKSEAKRQFQLVYSAAKESWNIARENLAVARENIDKGDAEKAKLCLDRAMDDMFQSIEYDITAKDLWEGTEVAIERLRNIDNVYMRTAEIKPPIGLHQQFIDLKSSFVQANGITHHPGLIDSSTLSASKDAITTLAGSPVVTTLLTTTTLAPTDQQKRQSVPQKV